MNCNDWPYTTAAPPKPPRHVIVAGDDLRDFCLMLRRALYMVIRWIDKRYGCEGG